MNSDSSTNGTDVDVPLFGHFLCEESPCPKAHLAIVVTEWDRSLRWLMEGLDVHRGLVWSGHGGWW